MQIKKNVTHQYIYLYPNTTQTPLMHILYNLTVDFNNTRLLKLMFGEGNVNKLVSYIFYDQILLNNNLMKLDNIFNFKQISYPQIFVNAIATSDVDVKLFVKKFNQNYLSFIKAFYT